MSLARLSCFLESNEEQELDRPKAAPAVEEPVVEFSDTSPSEESSQDSQDD